jgi:hypothetical protein
MLGICSGGAERLKAQEGDVEAGEVTEYDGITYATIRVRCSECPGCIYACVGAGGSSGARCLGAVLCVYTCNGNYVKAPALDQVSTQREPQGHAQSVLRRVRGALQQ